MGLGHSLCPRGSGTGHPPRILRDTTSYGHLHREKAQPHRTARVGPVFRIKRNADGPVDKDSARLVARGFMPSPRGPLFRHFLTLGEAFQFPRPGIACHDWEVEKFTNTDIRQQFAVYLTWTTLYARISKYLI